MVGFAVRLKIMTCLLRSSQAANTAALAVQVTSDAMSDALDHFDSSNARLGKLVARPLRCLATGKNLQTLRLLEVLL